MDYLELCGVDLLQLLHQYAKREREREREREKERKRERKRELDFKML